MPGVEKRECSSETQVMPCIPIDCCACFAPPAGHSPWQLSAAGLLRSPPVIQRQTSYQAPPSPASAPGGLFSRPPRPQGLLRLLGAAARAAAPSACAAPPGWLSPARHQCETLLLLRSCCWYNCSAKLVSEWRQLPRQCSGMALHERQLGCCCCCAAFCLGCCKLMLICLDGCRRGLAAGEVKGCLRGIVGRATTSPTDAPPCTLTSP